MKKIELQGVDEVIYYDVTDNGLPIYMWVNEKVNNYYLTLNVKYGSVHTEFKPKGEKKYVTVPLGIAHFLEHMNFYQPDGSSAFQYFEQNGASVNAFTSFQITAYEVFASTHFKENLDYLLDYVYTPYFTKEQIRKEKGIITEEIKMGKDDPGRLMYFGSFDAAMVHDKRKFFIPGEVEDVKQITDEDLFLVYNTFYHPENMFLVITGNFNPYEAAAIVKENMNKKEFEPWNKPLIKKVKEPQQVHEERKEIIANVEIPKVKFILKIPRNAFKLSDDLTLNICIGHILRANFGPTSDFQEELLENRLITSMSYTRETASDYLLLSVVAESKYPEEFVKRVEEQFLHLDITEKLLERRKKATIASLVLNYDDIEFVNSDIQDDIITYGKINDQLYDVYRNITLEQVKSVMKAITVINKSIVILKADDN